MGSLQAAKCWPLRPRFTIGSRRSSRQTAEHRAFDNPSLAQHVADHAVARRVAMVRLPAFAVVVEPNDRHAIGGTIVINRRGGVEGKAFEHSVTICLYLV